MAYTNSGAVLGKHLDTTDSFSLDETGKKIKVKKGVTGVRLTGSNLVVSLQDGTNHTAQLSSLVPASKADIFLKSVARDGENLVFTTGAAGVTNADQTITVAIGDLLKTKAGDGLQGEGTTASPMSVKLTSDSGLQALATGLALKLGTGLSIGSQGEVNASYTAGKGIGISNNTISVTSNYISTTSIQAEPVGDTKSYAVKEGSDIVKTKVPYRISLGSDNHVLVTKLVLTPSVESPVTVLSTGALAPLADQGQNYTFGTNTITISEVELLPNVPHIVDVYFEIDVRNLGLNTPVRIDVLPTYGASEIGFHGNKECTLKTLVFHRGLTYTKTEGV